MDRVLGSGLKSLSVRFLKSFVGAKGMVMVRGYRKSDESQILVLWNDVLPYDPIDRRTFHEVIETDLNFFSAHCFILNLSFVTALQWLRV